MRWGFCTKKVLLFFVSSKCWLNKDIKTVLILGDRCVVVFSNEQRTVNLLSCKYAETAVRNGITTTRLLRNFYGHLVYDTSSAGILSTDISSTMTFLAEIEAGLMKRILYQ